AFIFALAACSGDNNDADADNPADSDRIDKVKEDGAKIGFADENPYAYEEDGEVKGVAVDVATKVLNDIGAEGVEGELIDFGELIPGLQANKFDIITASMAITPERCENVEFGKPEVVYGEGLVVQDGNPKDITSYEDLAADSDLT